MQNTSTLYNNLLADQNHSFECRLDINGVEYGQDAILSAKPSFRVFESSPTIGGVYSSTLDFSLILPANTNIPRMAVVRPYFHVVANGTGSEWYPLGFFYIDTRTTSRNNSNINVLKAMCYDVMLKANAEYNESSLSWPATDIDVVREIATKMGTYIDYRTQSIMTEGYSIPFPVGKTYRDVLSYIAVMYCGNWVSSVSGNLLLMPLPPAGGNLNVGDSASTLSTSPTRSAYTKVQIALSEDSEDVVEAGSSDARVMTATCPYMTQDIAETIYNTLSSFAYTPFTANGVWSNPAVELGDTVTINGFSGTVYALEYAFGSGMVMEMSAPNDNYIDHEYAYESPTNRAYKRTVGNLTTSIEQNAEAIALTAQNIPALNLVPNVYYRENASGAVWTSNGITWTVNPDGTVTAEGTATANSDYYLASTTTTATIPRITLDPTRAYTYSGAPGVTGCQMRMGWWDAQGNGYTTYIESVSSATRSAGSVQCTPYLRIVSGTELPAGGVTFKPMLEVGTTAHEYVSSHNGSFAMQSQIQQNAENISLKVSQTDYTGNTIASLINQNATTVQIEAQKINLTGAVSISSLDSTTQAALLSNTTVKTQYYLSTSASSATGGTWYDSPNSITWSANHYVWTRVATTKTNASGTSSTTYSTAVYDKQLTSALSTAAAAATAAGNAQTTANATVTEAVPIYYRSMSSTTPTLVPGETYVYVTDNTDDQWSAVAPRPKKGAYFWESVRYTLGDGSRAYAPVRAWTSEQYASKWVSNADSSYIDGGAIYAHSVTADQIAANTITASEIAAQTITADRIDMTDVFSQSITATNMTITGGYVNITGLSSSETSRITLGAADGRISTMSPIGFRLQYKYEEGSVITTAPLAYLYSFGPGSSAASNSYGYLSLMTNNSDASANLEPNGLILKSSLTSRLQASDSSVSLTDGTSTGTLSKTLINLTDGTKTCSFGTANGLVMDDGTKTYSLGTANGLFMYAGSSKYSALIWPDSNGAGRFVLGDGASTKWRTELTNSGLVFRDVSDVVTASYEGNRADKVVTVSGSSMSVASATSGATSLCSITLGAGLWVILCNARLGTSANGYRYIALSTSSTSMGAVSHSATVLAAPASGNQTQISFPAYVNVSAYTTYYLNVRQNSGSAITCTGYIDAVKIA